MIKPLRQGNDFLDDVRSAEGRSEPFHVWWLGQSGFVLAWEGRRLVFDPYLSDSLPAKYAGTDKPHVRMTKIVVNPEANRAPISRLPSESAPEHVPFEIGPSTVFFRRPAVKSVPEGRWYVI